MKKCINKPEHKDYKYWVRTILVIFFAIQPILDVYMTLFDDYIQIVGISLATILRFGVVFALLVTVLFFEFKRKSTLLFFGYALSVLIYTVLHHFNAISFSVRLANADYNFLNELLYIARMCIPVAIIYIIYIVRLGYVDIKRVVVASSLTISLVIIITNLLNVGFISYSLEDRVILDNMISWFTGNPKGVYWQELSCRGFFQASNPTSGVVILLTPVLTYICLTEKRIKYWIVLVMQFVAMINLSTRVATIGGILVLAAILVIHLIELMIEKKISIKKLWNKNIVCCVVSLGMIFVFLINSPMISRINEGELFSDLSITDNEKDVVEDDREYSEKEKKMIEYIEKHWAKASIHEYHINQAYPYKDDPQFWYHLIKDVSLSERYGNRNIRKLLIERLFERDNRVSNIWLGISHTRSSTFVWPERDIETHLDSLGILGTVILIGPYFAIAILGIWNFFRRFKDNLHLEKCIYLIALGLGIFVAYFSGHIMNEVFPTTYLAMLAGIVLCACIDDKIKYAIGSDK